MNDKYEDAKNDSNIVYIKEVMASEVPADINLDALESDSVFALHDANGAQLAVAANRQLAVHLAKANDLVPMTLH